MAVEQRIGRIHRFGQKDVAQVYNLVAKDTVEERIYGLLTEKLQAVARAIGKVDRETGEPLEDFRLDILGFLGSNPNYQQLFKQALLDKDYQRTARQIEEMMQQAQQAREELRRVVGFSVADEIEKLDRLKKSGSISDAEFARLRTQLLR